MNKAVIYARYSSDSQTEQSIEGQLRVCKEFAERNGFVIVKEYIDRAKTGTNDNRPAFQQMIFDSKNKSFNFVLVYKLDRFSRNRYDSAINTMALSKNGVKVISATENISDKPEGRLLENVIIGINEYYSAELSQKVKRGLKESRIKGQFTGGRTPYGYNVENLKLSINETQANIVRLMFDEYLSGKKIKDIVVMLKDKGIKNGYGKDWSINSVSRVLRNENYKGVVYADDTVYTNIYPAIVSEEIFDEVNARLKVSKRTSAHHKTEVNYLLSGKLICGKCGGLMTGDCGKGKLGTIYNYYKCFTKKKNKSKCDKKSIPQQYIEDIVFEATQNFLQSANLKAIAKETTNSYNKFIEKDLILENLNKELQENNKKLANLLRALENGIFNDTTNDRMRELEIANKELKEKIISREMLTIKPLDENIVYAYLCSFKDLDYSLNNAKQRLIDMFVSRVVLYDNECFIYFNISDDKGTHLKLSEQPDFEQESEFLTKKEQPEHKCSDCYHLAEREGFEPSGPCDPQVFETCTLDHSDIFPKF